MSAAQISGLDAWMQITKSKYSQWSDNIERFSGEVCWVEHKPKFSLSKDDTYFCIGSCFARNIEEELIKAQKRVVSRGIISPESEWPDTRPSGIINKFTTYSMMNEIEWVARPPIIDKPLFDETAKGWLDLQLCPGVRPVTLERAIERRQYLTGQYFSRIKESSVVIITLGLNEVWFDRSSQRYLNATPSFTSVRKEPTRYSLEILSAQDNLFALEQAYATLKELNPHGRIIVTVSPVPMSQTFSGIDIVLANNYSKASLRTAAVELCRKYKDVDYFPSYDIVSMSPRSYAYEADCLQVSRTIVQKITKNFLLLYTGSSGTDHDYDELEYLQSHPHVEAAVRSGSLVSGFDHWIGGLEQKLA